MGIVVPEGIGYSLLTREAWHRVEFTRRLAGWYRRSSLYATNPAQCEKNITRKNKEVIDAWFAACEKFVTVGQQGECTRCDGTGWLDSIGPKSDGSYITGRFCPRCDGKGKYV